MTHVNYTDFRDKLASYLNEVCQSRAPLTVTRQDGEAVILMSEDEYEGLMETVHLLRSPANAGRLLASIAALDAGKGEEHDPTI